MRIIHRPQFEKTLSQLPREIILLVKEISDFFREDPFHASLRNHPLDPPMEKYRSISVDNDLRIIFRVSDEDTVIFYNI